MKIKNFYHLNQFVLTDSDLTYFQSYDSMIAKIDHNKSEIRLGSDYDYSKTTLKHLYLFFSDYLGIDGLNIKKLRNSIKIGSISNGYKNFSLVMDESL